MTADDALREMTTTEIFNLKDLLRDPVVSDAEVEAALEEADIDAAPVVARAWMHDALKAAYAASPLLQEVERRFQALLALEGVSATIAYDCTEVMAVGVEAVRAIINAPFDGKINPQVPQV